MSGKYSGETDVYALGCYWLTEIQSDSLLYGRKNKESVWMFTFPKHALLWLEDCSKIASKPTLGEFKKKRKLFWFGYILRQDISLQWCKGSKSLLSGRFGYPHGRPGDSLCIRESWHECPNQKPVRFIRKSVQKSVPNSQTLAEIVTRPRRLRARERL